MKRKEFNKNTLESCTRLLQSRDPNEILLGTILSAYLIEQAFKHELNAINPLLYFDKKSISDEMEVRIALGNLTEEELGRLKTSNAKRCITQICEYKKELAPHKTNFEELFDIRNSTLHSISDLVIDKASLAETAVSALRAAREYVANHSGISAKDFNPLTSAEFEKLEEISHKKRITDLQNKLQAHKKIAERLSKSEIEQKFKESRNGMDVVSSWVEEIVKCPACGHPSLEKIGTVDFDWNPDGILTSGGYYYQCYICGLHLSEYAYELVDQ